MLLIGWPSLIPGLSQASQVGLDRFRGPTTHTKVPAWPPLVHSELILCVTPANTVPADDDHFLHEGYAPNSGGLEIQIPMDCPDIIRLDLAGPRLGSASGDVADPTLPLFSDPGAWDARKCCGLRDAHLYTLAMRSEYKLGNS